MTTRPETCWARQPTCLPNSTGAPPFEQRESRDLTDIRVQAAICALLASQGRGVDADELTEEQRKSMRRQGLEWLHVALKDQLAGKPHAKETLFKIRLAKQNESLGRWMDAGFEPDEQRKWDAFWADVELAEQRQLHHLPSEKSGWELVKPSHLTSANRAQLTLEDDMSIFVTGPRVIADTYTIHTELRAADIRQLALVLPADERLPNKGPGRHQSGNYHLAEITVLSGDQAVPLTLLDYSYEWTGREAANAIDGNTNTDWHVWGQIGVSHFLTLGLDAQSDGNLTVQLKHGNEKIGATIGYFRLLVRE